ncbi:hypothetical protein AGABI1DRAFT_74849 [Agaricus bisporus var. burnettii JB137-S8]|uniref:ABC transporter domain-containing protein n=1 Tax=Agaricus bisporus var. burnettii (strain JB137-S8 / ATCC MYA-4627 / FGSC 10392) TaxID=597362 RepID=K5VYY0_AGABU|nr:uncharacterized protein AGABI1DRAFT_74849 [Agaricus bisporus var. burnettii JB137-S8]EKM79704.1 hypothetical protein AGABI1DRAFT_74849 [Agaricus bisporus var. burnettii JB137-S8]
MDDNNSGDSSASISDKPQKWKTSREQYGIWEVLATPEGHHKRYQRFFQDLPESLPSLYKLLRDIFSVSPKLVVFFLLYQLWAGCQEAAKLHLSGQVLRMIEQCLREGVPDYGALCYLLVLRLVVTALASIGYRSMDLLDRLQYQVASHFQLRIMKASTDDSSVEYQNASNRLGDVVVKPVHSVFSANKTPYLPTLLALLGELPTVYCAMLALLSPKSISFASITILQQSSSLLARHVSSVFSSIERVKRNLQSIHEMYQLDAHGSDDELTDPLATENTQVGIGRGMQFELRNVSFAYPGSQATRHALRNINLSINSGQFVVIVGSNGSGKSTLIKLLLRLYSPSKGSDKPESQNTSGEILIDNKPASSYSESSLRQSTAALSQENIVYRGFSLGENIGLGFSPLISDEQAIDLAAEKAGATEVLKRMKDGANTILDPLVEYHHFNVTKQSDDHPLRKILEEWRRPVEVSGGEKQRIVAGRTFMKFNSGKVKFLAVDEPTSALDAEGEEFLLHNLLKEREGKTVVFVTHKFGNLTKQADLIVCMKEGAMVESGTHAELMKKCGEYSKLYNIQARAFRDDPTPAAASEGS